jgi:hypothetical protein
MLRAVFTAAALLLSGMSLAQAADAQGSQAQIQAQAEKTCNDALEHDNFGAYQSMDECVTSTAQKLARAERLKVSDSKSVRPN